MFSSLYLASTLIPKNNLTRGQGFIFVLFPALKNSLMVGDANTVDEQRDTVLCKTSLQGPFFLKALSSHRGLWLCGQFLLFI